MWQNMTVKWIRIQYPLLCEVWGPVRHQHQFSCLPGGLSAKTCLAQISCVLAHRNRGSHCTPFLSIFSFGRQCKINMVTLQCLEHEVRQTKRCLRCVDIEWSWHVWPTHTHTHTHTVTQCDTHDIDDIPHIEECPSGSFGRVAGSKLPHLPRGSGSSEFVKNDNVTTFLMFCSKQILSLLKFYVDNSITGTEIEYLHFTGKCQALLRTWFWIRAFSTPSTSWATSRWHNFLGAGSHGHLWICSLVQSLYDIIQYHHCIMLRMILYM